MELDERVIDAVHEIANERYKHEYPLSSNHFTRSDVEFICEAMFDLSLAIIKWEEANGVQPEALGNH